MGNDHYEKFHSQPEDLECICEKCGLKFAIEILLRAHIRKEHQVGRHMCKHCEQRFQHRSAWLRHEATHQKIPEEEKHHCEFCDKKFTSKYNVKAHLKNMHDTTGKYHKHTCSTCDKRFVYKANLDVHKRVHTQDRYHHNYQCDLCSKAFKCEAGIRLHRQKIHKIFAVCGIPKEGGQLCDKKFSSVRGLSMHQRDAHGLFINLNVPHALPSNCKLFQNAEASDALHVDTNYPMEKTGAIKLESSADSIVI